jgi:hypothetical protein
MRPIRGDIRRALVVEFGGAAAVFFSVVSAGITIAAAAPVSGDTYVYRLVNGYSKEIRGQLRYRVDNVASDSFIVAVTPDNAAAGVERTEIYTKEGNWLRRPIDSHGQKVEYQFASAYPAYAFPLEAGKSWSVRVNAAVPGMTGVRSVRVDGIVLGSERIRVPAGEFDTIKIRRLVYPADVEYSFSETQIVELEWYAPALGRAVRTETRSLYFDYRFSRGNILQRGDWDVLELVDAGTRR